MLAMARSAKSVDIAALTSGDAVLVLTPHPDDESLGCGAAIAAACDSGVAVVVACLTDGTGSHPNSSSYPRDRLAALRLEELQAAVDILSDGRGKTFALGLPDQGAMTAVLAQSRAIQTLQDVVRSHAIGAMWTTWQKDAHIDHRCAANMAFELCAMNEHLSLWQFPIWSRFADEGIGPDEALFTFETFRYAGLKRRAIAAHKSQMSGLIDDDPTGFTLDRAKQEHFISFPEIFIKGSQHERPTSHI